MRNRSDLEIALALAGHYIEQLPEGCPYYLTAIEGQHVELDIAARTRDEFWVVARVINQLPKVVEEVRKEIGDLEVTVYLWEGELEEK